jgi:hypothetical protein
VELVERVRCLLETPVAALADIVHSTMDQDASVGWLHTWASHTALLRQGLAVLEGGDLAASSGKRHCFARSAVPQKT